MSERMLSASGTRYAIATPHAAATRSGVRAFEAGGNAIDAALAAAVTLAVVYPHMCGVGGDLFALVQRADADVIAVNSGGASPAGLDRAAVAATHAEMPERGPYTITVPGAVAGWEAVHRQGAALSWADAFADAIALARDGVVVTRSLDAMLRETAPILALDPGFRQVYLPHGSPPAQGDVFTNAALGSTLEWLATEGPRALYGGEVGRRYADGLHAAGSPLAPEDLTAHSVQLLAPLVGRYRDLDVRVTPPASQGFVLLEILATIERLRIDPDPFGPDAGAIALATLIAARDRDRHLADPTHMRVHPHALLDDGHIAAICDLVRSGRVPPVHAGATDTVGIVTADADGLAVSLIQSLASGFGSGILEPGTGIIAQSRGSAFTLDAAHPNVLGPVKRPAHTLMPVMAHRAGRLVAVSGTMGGAAHPQINAWSLIRAFDLDQHAADAVAAPRWLTSGMDAEGPEPFALAEPGVPGDVIHALREAGFRVDALPEMDESVGHAHLLLVQDDGAFDVGTDPRADGEAGAD